MDFAPHTGAAQAGSAKPPGFAAGLPESLREEIRQLEELEHSLRPLLSQTGAELRELAGLAETIPAAPAAAETPENPEPVPEALQHKLRLLELRVQELEERCSAVTQLAAVNCARIEEILHCRTWRILTSLGGLFVRRRS